MKFADTNRTFGMVSILNHWASAALIFILIGTGLTLEEMARGPEKFELVQLHKSFGTAFLALVVIRLAWRLTQGFPEPAAPASPWAARAARLWHLALLAVITALPLSGWIASSAAGHQVSFFGLAALPDLVGRDWALHEAAETVHGILGHLIVALIALHIVAAVKHHFWDRDQTLIRMLGARPFAPELGAKSFFGPPQAPGAAIRPLGYGPFGPVAQSRSPKSR